MNKFVMFFVVTFCLLPVSFAELPAFNNISATQLETITKEFGASTAHTSVSGAASLGTVFGVEAGLVAGIAKSDGIEEIVQAVNPGESVDVSAIPHAALLVAASLPIGIGAEVTFLPSFDAEDINFERTGFAGKWTLTNGLLSIPLVDLAIKAHYTTSTLTYAQAATSSSPAANVTFDAKTLGFDVMVGTSLDLLLVGADVYASLGYVSIDGTLSATASIFDSTVAGLSSDSKQSGLDLKVGANVKLLLFKIGAEYEKLVDTDRFSFKISAKF